MTPLLWSLFLVPLVGVAVLTGVPVILMVERRGSAWLQRRTGPNRVGPFGLLQPMADAIKMVFKEENQPARASKFLFIFAPVLAILPPIVGFSMIPIAQPFTINGESFAVQIVKSDLSFLFLLAITSLHVFAVLIAGWASNNKFSLMGALRAGSQMISYEVAIGLCLVSLVVSYGTLNLSEIVTLQGAGSRLAFWGFFMQPLVFLIMWVSVFAECNRLPFDLPEGETELVAGYHTEYSGLKFGLFFLGEYAAMYLASALMATVFLGGYNIPFVSPDQLVSFVEGLGLYGDQATWVASALSAVSFAAKVFFFMFVFVWVRWTLPRFRYDQLVGLGWKVLLPLATINLIGTMIFSFLQKGAY